MSPEEKNPIASALSAFLAGIQVDAQEEQRGLASLGEFEAEVSARIEALAERLHELLVHGAFNPNTIANGFRAYIPTALTPYMRHSHNPKMRDDLTILIETSNVKVTIVAPKGKEPKAPRNPFQPPKDLLGLMLEDFDEEGE